MKKILLIITIAATAFAAVVATKNSIVTKKDQNSSQYTDTVGLAQFQAMKIQAVETKNTSSVARKAPAKTVSGSMNSVSSHPAKTEEKTEEKKGWSKAAKGTAIGAGTGAILGAIINKRNRAAGAAIGGALGGGIGYGIGRHMDKKDGRS